MTDAASLARLIWQPGRHMDDAWWDAFGMARWRAVYRKYPACRASVDRRLVERRGWPTPGQYAECRPPDSEAAQAALRLMPSLRRVAVAYGLRTLGCPDYLLLGVHRRALSGWLDAWQCDRLLLMRRDWPSTAALAPEAIGPAAMALTAACLDAVRRACAPRSHGDVATVHAAVRQLLPPANAAMTATADVPVVDDIWPQLAALERMLCMSSTTH
ncbi:hypothetical protein UC34_25155 [Pandoraea vervacti]|uniref:Type III secretion system (T3SS) protein HrpB4 n=1 Tax=Pandoraea vervacti TaxID=656178 RepID=A0ABM6FQQ9_9BURK|nr:type III secretion system domain-containing protein [Pandoraea vervacti]APD11146.1 hypothetical protein UC34_25155 [Pandoraea vervacti]